MADNQSRSHAQQNVYHSVATGLALGAGVGVALGAGVGVALGHIALGAAVGTALGAASGAGLRAACSSRQTMRSPHEDDE